MSVSSPHFDAFVSKELKRFGIPQSPDLSFAALTAEEKEKLAAISFSEELKFTVPVNLADSKAAFINLLLGFNSPSDFLGSLTFKPHDPWNYPNPIGDVEVAKSNALRLRQPTAINSAPRALCEQTELVNVSTGMRTLYDT